MSIRESEILSTVHQDKNALKKPSKSLRQTFEGGQHPMLFGGERLKSHSGGLLYQFSTGVKFCQNFFFLQDFFHHKNKRKPQRAFSEEEEEARQKNINVLLTSKKF